MTHVHKPSEPTFCKSLWQTSATRLQAVCDNESAGWIRDRRLKTSTWPTSPYWLYHYNLPIKNRIVAHSSPKFQYDSLTSQWLCVCVSLWCLAQQQQNSVGLTVSITAVSQWQKKNGNKGYANYWGKYLNREKRRRYGGKKGKPNNEHLFLSFIILLIMRTCAF